MSEIIKFIGCCENDDSKSSDEEQKKMFYYQVDEPTDENVCANLDARNHIADFLKTAGFIIYDTTGGQASFYDEGDFNIFQKIVKSIAKIYNYNVVELKHCVDPGLGLFMDVKYNAS